MKVLNWLRRRAPLQRDATLSDRSASKIKSETRALIRVANDLESLLNAPVAVDAGSRYSASADGLARKLVEAEERLIRTIAEIAKDGGGTIRLSLRAVRSVVEGSTYVSALARTAVQRVAAHDEAS